jgi:hypothetical protein
MSWDPTQPTNATKIRLSPALFQANWQAIEGGAVPSRKWQLAFRLGDPGGIAGSGLIFTKLNGSGFTELFFKDDNSNVTRLTNGGGVGYWTQPLYGSDIRLQTGAFQVVNTQQAFCSAQGRVASNGVLQAGSYGIASAVRNGSGSGNYTVTFTDPMTSADNYSILLTPRNTGGTSAYVSLLFGQTAADFSVQMQRYSFSSNDFVVDDVGFCFAVFGGRV